MSPAAKNQPFSPKADDEDPDFEDFAFFAAWHCWTWGWVKFPVDQVHLRFVGRLGLKIDQKSSLLNLDDLSIFISSTILQPPMILGSR